MSDLAAVVGLAFCMHAVHARDLPLVDGPVDIDQWGQLRDCQTADYERVNDPICLSFFRCRDDRCRVALALGHTDNLLVHYYRPSPMSGVAGLDHLRVLPVERLLRRHPKLRPDAERMLVALAGLGLDGDDLAWLYMMSAMTDPSGATQRHLIAIDRGLTDPQTDVLGMAHDDCVTFHRYGCDAFRR